MASALLCVSGGLAWLFRAVVAHVTIPFAPVALGLWTVFLYMTRLFAQETPPIGHL